MRRRRKSFSLQSILEFWIPLVYFLIGITGAVTAVSGWFIASDDVMRLGFRILCPPIMIAGFILLIAILSGLIYLMRFLFSRAVQ